MNNLRRLGNQMSISIPPDEDGMTGRECPIKECLGYFKLQFGTGLKGKNLPCHCPYCGHVAGHDKFWTPAQLQYAKSVAINRISQAVIADLKSLEFNHRPSGPFGIGISMKVEGHPSPIHRYRERKLETTVVCDHCTLRYAIYGVYAFCPDCGEHNSLQILNSNLEIAGKMLLMAGALEGQIADQLVGNALEDAVSAFDGFGRQLVSVYAGKSGKPEPAAKMSFQNLTKSREAIRRQFGFDYGSTLNEDDWEFAHRSFQRRHILAHRSGVIDDEYIRSTGDSSAIAGRKLVVTGADVGRLVDLLRQLGGCLARSFREWQPTTAS